MIEILERLAAPFPPDAVEWRLGTMKSDKTKGMALAYIDARTVQDRLDDVCGPFWACEHVVSGGTRVTCRIGIKIGDEWVWRSDGAGETDVEGEKGSYSDSFKRAAVKWRVGRYLYDLDSPWVETEAMGKSYRIKDSERSRLNAILARKPAARAAISAPVGQKLIASQPNDAQMGERISPAMEYAAKAKIRIQTCADAKSLLSWWEGEAEARKKAGLTREDPIGVDLGRAFVARKSELSKVREAA